MPGTRGRIEALSEIFESEKSYVADLTMWERDFRMWILECSLFGLKIKYEICDRVFINMEGIRKLHEEILADLAAANLRVYSEIVGIPVESHGSEFMIDKTTESCAVEQLEYFSVYRSHLQQFEMYEDYAQRLSKAEFELEKLMYSYPGFSDGVHAFLDAKEISFLGIKHFLYRPSQKLARYPMLIRAVIKNERSEKFRQEYETLAEWFQRMARTVDREFSNFSTQFMIYRLGENFRYKENVRNQQCLGMFQKRRRLLKEGEVLVKHHTGMDLRLAKMFVFDHVILICEFPQDKFAKIEICDEPVFMTRLVVFRKDLGFFPADAMQEKFFPLFLLEAGESRVCALYFGDKSERNVYYTIIQRAIRKVKARLREDVVLERLSFKPAGVVRYACQATRRPWATESSDEEDPGDSSSYSSDSESEEESLSTMEARDFSQGHVLLRTMSEFLERNNSTQNKEPHKKSILRFGMDDSTESSDVDYDDPKRQSLWKRLFSGTSLFVKNGVFPLPADRSADLEYMSQQKNMYIVATDEGVFRVLGGDAVKVLDDRVKKVVYDSTYEVMIYHADAKLYASHFNSETTSAMPVVLKKDIGDFFYGTTSHGSYIASRDYGNGNSSMVFLFAVMISRGSVRIELSRKLYVGFQIYNIFFCSEKIVIACKDFEVVDLDSLRTEELLEVYDPWIPVFFHALRNTTARCILPISPHTFLVCFDALGFIIDDLGKVKRTGVIFLWDCRPTDFKLFHNHVVCIGHNLINIFNLNTGILVFSRYQVNLRFVSESEEPLLHDGRRFYRINFGAPSTADAGLPAN